MHQNIKVLLVDNSEYFGLPCAQTMRAHGLEVQTMEKNGKRVADVAAQMRPDVVLMDMFLSGLDAIGVMKALHNMHLSPMPQIIVMANVDNPMLEMHAIQNGADYYFLKPFDVDEMAERITVLCGRAMPEPARNVTHMSMAVPRNGLEIRVTEILHQIGVPAHIKGYQYIRDAILMAIDDEDIINAVTKRLYPAVAKKHDTTSSRVERSIRHAIEVAWDRGDVEVLNTYFGYTIHNERGKPTNSEFIAMISDKFRLQLKIG